MLLPAKTTLRFLGARQRGPGEYMEAAEREPTMEALRWVAEISWLLSGDLPEPATFAGKCRRPGGAFAMTIADPEPSRAASYYAVRALTLCRQRAGIPPQLPRWFASELAAPDQPASSDIDEMFYVLRALEQLDAFSLLSADVTQSLVGFIRRCRAADGGYAGVPGEPSDTEHTYCAVCSLSLLGHPLGEAESRATVAWLRDRFGTDSGLAALTPANGTPSLAASYWGFRAGEVLGATVWTDRLAGAVEALSKPDGGFGARPHATLWESYCALRVLSALSAPLSAPSPALSSAPLSAPSSAPRGGER